MKKSDVVTMVKNSVGAMLNPQAPIIRSPVQPKSPTVSQLREAFESVASNKTFWTNLERATVNR